jgi:hypothetical protein
MIHCVSCGSTARGTAAVARVMEVEDPICCEVPVTADGEIETTEDAEAWPDEWQGAA